MPQLKITVDGVELRDIEPGLRGKVEEGDLFAAIDVAKAAARSKPGKAVIIWRDYTPVWDTCFSAGDTWTGKESD